MKEILQKISSYNLFNYLFPGIIFTYLLNKYTDYNIVVSNIIIELFIYYFIGLTISRVGSVIIEPILKKIKFVEFSDFVKASAKDNKIDILSEVNNMYRSLIAMILVFFIVLGYSGLKRLCDFFTSIELYLCGILLFIFFLFAYKKQTKYISKRVKSNI